MKNKFGGYSEKELRKVFEKVCNKNDWKLPISRIIKEEDQTIVTRAIMYFSGCMPTFFFVKKKGFLRVKAPGYYSASSHLE